jgi:hypothetical protein
LFHCDRPLVDAASVVAPHQVSARLENASTSKASISKLRR